MYFDDFRRAELVTQALGWMQIRSADPKLRLQLFRVVMLGAELMDGPAAMGRWYQAEQLIAKLTEDYGCNPVGPYEGKL